MICELCKEHESTVHLTQVIDGSIKKLHLCEECAAKSGIDVHGPISITDILLGMGIKGKEAEAMAAGGVGTTTTERSCPRCHMRRTDFKKTGRFGCSTCYEAFAEELPPLLKAMHRSELHVGKVPAAEAVRVKATNELASLELALKKAVDTEDFEEAARVRDQISSWRRKLDQELKSK